jgi:hypothetical protein
VGRLSDIQIGSVRRLLDHVVTFVRGPAPVGSPAVVQSWCRERCGMDSLEEIARQWGTHLRELGKAVLLAGLEERARRDRPQIRSHLRLVDLNSMEDFAHDILCVAIDIADGACVDNWQIEDVLSNVLVTDQVTFQRFTVALRDRVELLFTLDSISTKSMALPGEALDLDRIKADLRRRQETSHQIAEIRNRLDERRRQVTAAIEALDAVLSVSAEGEALSNPGPDTCEHVRDAFIGLCKVVRDCKFDEGIEDILRRDRADARAEDRLAILLFRLSWHDRREDCLELLREIGRLPLRPDQSDVQAPCQINVWSGVKFFFNVILPWPDRDGVFPWHPDWQEMLRLKASIEPRCEPERDPAARQATEFVRPLVAIRTHRRNAARELARDPDRNRQSRYCQGFDPDWWMPALKAAKWKSRYFPLYPTPESVCQWLGYIDALCVEYLGPFGAPEDAAELSEHRDHDLELIRAQDPELYALVQRPASDQAKSASTNTLSSDAPDLSEVRDSSITDERVTVVSTSPDAERQPPPSALLEASGTDPGSGADAACYLRRQGRVWQIRFHGEIGDFPEKGTNCLRWMAIVLARPNHSFPVNELLGDVDGKLASGTRFSAEAETDWAGFKALKRELDDVDTLMEIGSTEALEHQKADILRRLERAQRRPKLTGGDPFRKAHHNVCTQIRKFVRSLKYMPHLANHLVAALKLEYPHVGYYPPSGSSAWNM